MRTIEWTGRFKKDYKREKKRPHKATLDEELAVVINRLAVDEPLPDKYRDHALIGNWQDFRDCHVRPDLVLIYRKLDQHILQLVRLGSHSELGL
jgi:mRNA interferase YafQ